MKFWEKVFFPLNTSVYSLWCSQQDIHAFRYKRKI